MTLSDRYQQRLAAGEITPDPAQQALVERLQRLAQTLTDYRPARPGRWDRLGRLIGRRREPPPQGLYIWGGVGRGKTFLVDLFYEALPFAQKKRMHFHRFMQAVHDELKRLNRTPEPLDIVAATLAQDARVICFDEFYVADITDAMILARLLDELFALGVVMVATSNTVPDELYRNGLQRGNFLPAIALIKQRMEVHELASPNDYRLRALERAEIYHAPLDAAAERNLHQTFIALSPEVRHEGGALEINGRAIPSRWRGDGVVWFDFDAVCDGPRCPADYIELARCFNTVLVSGIPQLDRYQDDRARRFISLVDEFYDRRVKLLASAAVAVEALYAGGNLSFEFQRTVSRLLEMQSHDYLALEHRP